MVWWKIRTESRHPSTVGSELTGRTRAKLKTGKMIPNFYLNCNGTENGYDSFWTCLLGLEEVSPPVPRDGTQVLTLTLTTKVEGLTRRFTNVRGLLSSGLEGSSVRLFVYLTINFPRFEDPYKFYLKVLYVVGIKSNLNGCLREFLSYSYSLCLSGTLSSSKRQNGVDGIFLPTKEKKDRIRTLNIYSLGENGSNRTVVGCKEDSLDPKGRHHKFHGEPSLVYI